MTREINVMKYAENNINSLGKFSFLCVYIHMADII